MGASPHPPPLPQHPSAGSPRWLSWVDPDHGRSGEQVTVSGPRFKGPDTVESAADRARVLQAAGLAGRAGASLLLGTAPDTVDSQWVGPRHVHPVPRTRAGAQSQDWVMLGSSGNWEQMPGLPAPWVQGGVGSGE